VFDNDGVTSQAEQKRNEVTAVASKFAEMLQRRRKVFITVLSTGLIMVI